MELINELINNVQSVKQLDEYEIRSLAALFKLTLDNVQPDNETTNIELKDTKCDVEQVVSIYNEMFKGYLPKVNIIDTRRRKLVNARFKQYGYKGIREAFDKVKESDYLLYSCINGGWKCTFDFIFSPSGFTKILEGNYNGKQQRNTNNTTKTVGISDNLQRKICAGLFPEEHN